MWLLGLPCQPVKLGWHFYLDHEEEGSDLTLLLHHFVPLWVIVAGTGWFQVKYNMTNHLTNLSSAAKILVVEFGYYNLVLQIFSLPTCQFHEN